MSRKAKLGLSFIPEQAAEFREYSGRIDVIEFFPESFFYQDFDEDIDYLLENNDYCFHSLDLSLGSESISDEGYYQKWLKTNSRMSPKWNSDHLCQTKNDQDDGGHLMPIIYNDESLEIATRKIKRILADTDKQFLVENLASYYDLPMCQMSESEFIHKLVRDTNCGVLLDVNNLYVNSINKKTGIDAYLRDLPMDAVGEIHLAGGELIQGMLVDTHGAKIQQEVWHLFDRVLDMCDPCGVIIERDTNIPKFQDTLSELEIARDIYCRH